jgi:hypothetical protein
MTKPGAPKLRRSQPQQPRSQSVFIPRRVYPNVLEKIRLPPGKAKPAKNPFKV